MALTNLSFVSGLTALLIVVTSIGLGIYLILSYQKSKSSQTLALAATIFSVGWIWSSIAINFLLSTFGFTEFLPDLIYLLIFAWAPAVGLIGTTYLVTSLLKPSLLKPIGAIAIILCVIHLVLMYVLVPTDTFFSLDDVIKFDPLGTDELPDANADGLLRIFSLIAIIAILISGLFFLYTGLKTDISFVKARGLFMGIGFSAFAILITFDTITESLGNVFLIVILRLSIVFVLFILAVGITLPGFIFNRFGISKPS
jgi:hypothetical protein